MVPAARRRFGLIQIPEHLSADPIHDAMVMRLVGRKRRSTVLREGSHKGCVYEVELVLTRLGSIRQMSIKSSHITPELHLRSLQKTGVRG